VLDGDIAVSIAALLVGGPFKDTVEPLSKVDIVCGGELRLGWEAIKASSFWLKTA
jgi:hypothetical protein